MKPFSIKPAFVLALLVSALGLLNPNDAQSQAAQVNGKLVILPHPSKCCTDYPFKLTTAAQGMLQAFNKLVTKTGVGQCTANKLITSLTSAMPAEYIGNGKITGLVSYGVYYKDAPASQDGIEGPDRIRVTWASEANNALGYTYYGVCKPNPILFPPGMGENHVYGAKFIPVERYKLDKGKYKYAYLMPGTPVAQISEIVNVFVEAKGGYMDTKEHGLYSQPTSSVGVVAVVRLKNNTLLRCYVVNNYDSGWLKWKDSNSCVGL